ncbi:MAG TPA: porin family protein [Candidatus Aminicenantes bacterium]|nr:porin family protein [Candidatus Aminicenantes bacterium]
MKKTIVAAVLAVALTALVPLGLQAGVGLKGGLSWSSLAITSTPPLPFSFDKLQFYAGGLSFSLGLGFVAIQPEVLYVRMGGLYEVDADNSLELRHSYVQAPLLLKLNLVPGGPIRPFICVGGYGSYLIKAEGVMKVSGVMETEDLSEDYQKFDYGLVGGAGLTFKLPGIALSVEGRYNYGLANIAKDPSPGYSLKNRCLMALVGIGF